MILFYEIETGKIFASVDGRVHDENTGTISNGLPEEKIGRYIIGITVDGERQTEHHMDMFEVLKRFEDHTPFSPYNCKVINGELILPDNA